MTDQGTVLHALERNRFFYGKVMDVRQFRMEQSYGMQARQLLAHYGLGFGVLSGLGVDLAPDGKSVRVRAGVAIDIEGRSIVVPTDVILNAPNQPTDCNGNPSGDPITSGTLTLALCYHECLTEPVTAIACGCDTVEKCEPGVVCEKYRLCLVAGLPSAAGAVACPVMFPASPAADFDRRHAVWDTFSASPIPADADPAAAPSIGVVLATITFAGQSAPTLDAFTYRQTIYSNQALFELILCLADRVDACCGDHAVTAAPPRVMRTWPSDQMILKEQPNPAVQHWVKSPRIEVALERSVADAILDSPDAWLRAWTFLHSDNELVVRRIALTRETGGQPLMLGAVGTEQVVAYLFDEAYRQELEAARVLVQLRPGDSASPIVVDGSTPPVLLDGEHHATAFDQATLDKIWSIGSGRNVVDSQWWDGLVVSSPPALPSGDGVAGGNMDYAFTFARTDVVTPKLLAIWPPNAAFLRPRSPSQDEQLWRKIFRERPHLELTFESSVDANAIQALNLEDWLRLWWVPEVGSGANAVRLKVTPTGVLPSSQLGVAGTTLGFDVPEFPFDNLKPTVQSHFAWIVLGDKASVDSDFVGFDISNNAVDELWNNDKWADGPPSGPSSIGATLADGQLGGTVNAYFDYADKM